MYEMTGRTPPVAHSSHDAFCCTSPWWPSATSTKSVQYRQVKEKATQNRRQGTLELAETILVSASQVGRLHFGQTT